jgi:hypothetical protein
MRPTVVANFIVSKFLAVPQEISVRTLSTPPQYHLSFLLIFTSYISCVDRWSIYKMSEEKLIDLDELEAITGGDQEIKQELFILFLYTVASDVDTLK